MKNHFVKRVIFLFFLFISMVPPGHSAWGHGVNIFAWLEGETVYVESKFKGGKRVRAGSIVVMDMQGHELLSGITNEDGEFSFKIPRREDLKIVLTAGAGHRAEWTLAASEMGEWSDKATATEFTAATATERTAATATEFTAAKGQGIKTVSTSHPSRKEQDSPQNPQYDAHDLENAIEALLERKLRPIMKMLVEERHRGPRARDVLAGVGYIFGLVGIVAYVQSRRRKG